MKDIAYWEKLLNKAERERKSPLSHRNESPQLQGLGKKDRAEIYCAWLKAQRYHQREMRAYRDLTARIAFYQERIRILRARTYYDTLRQGGLQI